MDARCTVAVVFIAGLVDYCNGILYAESAQVIHRLQMVLNAAVRLVVGAGKFQHITSVHHDVLHWLPVPVRQRIHGYCFRLHRRHWSSLLQRRLHASH